MSRFARFGHQLYTGEVSYDFVGRRRRWYIISAILIAVSLLVVLGTLGLGIVSVARGGDFNRKWGNRFMRWRVTAQAISIGIILFGFWYTGAHQG